MEEDHKARIIELEARTPGTLPAEKKTRVEAFRVASTQMQCRVEEAQKMLSDALAS